MAKVDRIQGPVEVMQGGVGRFRAIASDISPDQEALIRWTLKLPNQAERAAGRGANWTRTIDGTLGTAKMTARMPNQSDPAQHSFNVVQAAWPELDKDWRIESEYAPHPTSGRPGIVLARFRKDQQATAQFIVGSECSFGKRRGLALSLGTPYYRAVDYAADPEIGHWAHVIEPTARVEGAGSLAALNTYDNASFTFGFVQFSAKSYKANLHSLLVRWFADASAKAAQFLPKLRVENGEIYGFDALGKSIRLTFETRKENDELRRYLKPDPAAVTGTEIEFGARFVYWTRFFLKSHRHQVALAVEDLKGKIVKLLPGDLLDKKVDRVFVWLVDMYNQGAPPRSEIVSALGHAEPEKALKELKSKKHADRAARLDTLIKASSAFGWLFDRESQTFEKPE